MPTMNIHDYPIRSFAFRSQPLIFSIPVCNIDCRTVKNQYSYCFKANVFLTCCIIMFLMSIRLIQSLLCESLSSYTFKSTYSKQLIQDLDRYCNIALNKRFVLALNYEIRPLNLNRSKQNSKISLDSPLGARKS